MPYNLFKIFDYLVMIRLLLFFFMIEFEHLLMNQDSTSLLFPSSNFGFGIPYSFIVFRLQFFDIIMLYVMHQILISNMSEQMSDTILRMVEQSAPDVMLHMYTLFIEKSGHVQVVLSSIRYLIECDSIQNSFNHII